MGVPRRSVLAIIGATVTAPFIAVGKVFGVSTTAADKDEPKKGEKKELTAEEKEIVAKLKDNMKRMDDAIRKVIDDLGLADKIDIAEIKYASTEELKKLYTKAGKKYDRKDKLNCICQCCVGGFYGCCYVPGCNPC